MIDIIYNRFYYNYSVDHQAQSAVYIRLRKISAVREIISRIALGTPHQALNGSTSNFIITLQLMRKSNFCNTPH